MIVAGEAALLAEGRRLLVQPDTAERVVFYHFSDRARSIGEAARASWEGAN